MPIKEIAKAAHAKASARKAGIGKYVKRISAPLRYRLARMIVCRRAFWLLLLCSAWPLLVVGLLVMATPGAASLTPLTVWLRKISVAIGLLTAYVPIYYAAKHRWRKLKR